MPVFDTCSCLQAKGYTEGAGDSLLGGYVLNALCPSMCLTCFACGIQQGVLAVEECLVQQYMFKITWLGNIVWTWCLVLTWCVLRRSAKKNVGSLLGNDQMQAEGKGTQMKGDAKKTANS